MNSAGAVSSLRSGPLTTIVLHRPEVANAVDGPTAAALSDAFRAFLALWCEEAERIGLANRVTAPGQALANEWDHGVRALQAGEARDGAARFAAGAGRHGALDSEPAR